MTNRGSANGAEAAGGRRRLAARCARAAALLVLAGVAGCAGYARDRFYEEAFLDIAPEGEAVHLGQQSAVLARDLAQRDVLTLTECIRLAIARSEHLKAGGERLLQADARRYEAFSALLPRADFRSRWRRDSDAIEREGEGEAVGPTRRQERTEHSLVVTQTLFDGRILPEVRLAAAAERVAGLDLRDMRDRLAFEVASTFYDVLGLEEDLTALDSARNRAAELLRVLRVHLRVGETDEQEVLLTESRLSEIEAQLAQGRNDRMAARARLGRLLGVSAVPGRLQDTLDVDPPTAPIEELVAHARAERYDLQAARERETIASRERDRALADFLPRVSLDFTWLARDSGELGGELDWLVGINLDIPIFAGGGGVSRAVQAASVRRERGLEADAVAKDVALEVQEAVFGFRGLDEAMVSYERRAAAARGAEERSMTQLRIGEATHLDVLTAQAERESAERDLARAVLGRKLAALRIWLASGQIHRSQPVRALADLDERP